MAKAYYNEIDPYAAQWLRNLITRGHIAPGDVDERSIEDVAPSDLDGYTQCHFFAGIGVWSYALRQAGWPDDRTVWTGSCPCQPFSTAGKAGGFADERHLWPAFFHLIEQRRPRVVLGEQVASKDGLAWLDLVHADLEGTGYSAAALDLCAAGVGAPHIRQRLYWVADADEDRLGEALLAELHHEEHNAQPCGSERGGLGHTLGARLEGHPGHVDDRRRPRWQHQEADRPVATPGCTGGFWRDVEWFSFRDGKLRPAQPGTFPLAARTPSTMGRLRAYGNALCAEVAIEFIDAFMRARP